jgi:hypothetical protein
MTMLLQGDGADGLCSAAARKTFQNGKPSTG